MNRKLRVNNPGWGFARRAVVAILGIFLAAPLLAQQRQTLRGHILAGVTAAPRIATLSPPQRLPLTIGLPLRNREVLTNLLDQLYNPASTNFHHYLTMGQFTEQFGPTESDYQAVIDFARTNGLAIRGTHPNRTLVDVEGSTADIDRVFHVNIGVYQHPTEARTFFAPDVEPSVDLTVPILHIEGLDSFFVSHPHVRGLPVPKFSKAMPNIGAGSGPGGEYWGNDYRAAYAPGVALNGAGQQLALYELEGYSSSDITTYENQSGLPHVIVQNIPIDGFSFVPNNTDTNGVLEVCLDIEVAIAMAPGLNSVLVYGATNGPGVQLGIDILNRIATDNQAAQISSSWGINVNASVDQIFQQFAVQGESFFMAVGDSDAYVGTISQGNDDPYITVVGGTTLTTDAKTNWQSEVVWNNNISGITPPQTGTSGGISTTYAIPSWQRNVSMASNQGSTAFRNIPDVAMVADNVYTVFRGGQTTYTIGTSIAAPLWAGFTALVNQQAAALGHPYVGFLNPALYGYGLGVNPGIAYHDITSGNNTSTNSPSKFFAVPGYDLCTGWGSPNGSNFINSLAIFGSVTWVDFNYTGSAERGDFDTPFKTMAHATNAAAGGGVIAIKPGTTSETITITKPLTIISSGGSATIGPIISRFKCAGDSVIDAKQCAAVTAPRVVSAVTIIMTHRLLLCLAFVLNGILLLGSSIALGA